MTELVIYESMMCCSTGLCGPEPDSKLVEFNQTLQSIKDEHPEIKITRASISSGLNLFLENKEIFQRVKNRGPQILPIITYDGHIVSETSYLSHSDLKKAIEKINNKSRR